MLLAIGALGRRLPPRSRMLIAETADLDHEALAREFELTGLIADVRCPRRVPPREDTGPAPA